jgi:hypothetical protein
MLISSTPRAPRAAMLQIGGVGQTEAAVEAAAGPFDPAVTGAIFARLARTVATDSQHAVFGDNLDILGINTRDVGAQDVAVFLLLDVHRWNPVAGGDAGLIVAGGVGLEQPVQFLAQVAHVLPGFVTARDHDGDLLGRGMLSFK